MQTIFKAHLVLESLPQPPLLPLLWLPPTEVRLWIHPPHAVTG